MVRKILDRPRWHEWLRFGLDHIRQQCPEFKLTLEDFHPEALEWSYYHDACLQPGSHEMVELLSRMAEVIPVKYHKYLHRGLTTSNVIDSCNHLRWAVLWRLYVDRYNKVVNLVGALPDLAINGYTHGQLAHRTTLQHRSMAALLRMHEHVRFNDYLTGGPTGWKGSQNQGAVQRQCYPRHAYFQLWSMMMAASAGLAQLAFDYRVYAMSPAMGVKVSLSGTTSSCMPDKCNPTQFERINSLDLLIRSIGVSLMQIPPMMLEHDLVHSALEREQVDRLWEYLFYQAEQMEQLIQWTKVEVEPATMISSHDLLNQALDEGIDWSSARRVSSDRAKAMK